MKKLRIIYGRSGSGKTTYGLKEIRKNLDGGTSSPLVLLVPEQYTFQAERDLIKVLGTGGIMTTEVLSFRRLAFRVFNQVGGITYPHLHSAGKCMILYRILDKYKANLKVFGKAANREGFVDTISTLINEFKRYDISPEILEKVAADLEEGDFLKEKLTEISIIYAEYENMLSERYRDADDDLGLAARKIPLTDIWDNAEIWIDGFSGFTPQEYKVITQLLNKAKRITISLCTDSLERTAEATDVFSAVKKAYKRLIAIAQEIGAEVESSIELKGQPLPRFMESPELSHLERYFQAFPYQIYQEITSDITLFSSVNPFSEIEAIARKIVHLCRDKGLRYRDIAVVTGNLEGYEGLIRVIFDEYEIPYFLDQKVAITDHPLVQMVLSMLDIFNEQWSYEAVFRYLKTGLTGIKRESIDRIENYVLACGIRGNRWTKDEEWKMSPDLIPDERDLEKNKEMLLEINQIRAEITWPLLAFRDKTRGRRKALEICTALHEFFYSIGVPARIEGIIEQFQYNGQLELANTYAQIWNIIMDVFDQTVEVMSEETVGLERFSQVLKIGLSQYQVGLIPASLDQVLVGSVERSKSHDIKALFLMGVNDGVFPSTILEEGILSDSDRAILNRAGIELANDTRTQAFEEQYLVYKTLTTSSQYLHISWPIADQEGKSMRPSIIISRLRKLFPRVSETSNILAPISTEGEIELVAGKSPSFKLLVRALRQRAEGKEIHPIWQDIYRWYTAQEGWLDKCTSLKKAVLYRNVADAVSSDKVMALYGNPAQASVSRLEKYSHCPFAFYVQYGLGARERKIYRMSSPDVGTFMHTVIEKFSLYVTENNISWRDFDREWCGEKVSQIVDEILEKMEGADSGLTTSKRYSTLILRLKRVVTRAVWLIAEHIRRSNFEPVGYELGFGEKEKFPPIVIELESGQKINLIGRIDRVDALQTEEGTYLRIVDYKSGNKDFKLADVYYGIQIQLLTYLDALWDGEVGLGTPLLPGGVLYFRIDDPIIKANGKLSEEKVEEAIMKQLRMKGLILADVKLVKEMDKTINGSSLIIPARINRGDILGKSSAATLEQFYLIRKYVRKHLQNLCDEIMRGNVAIQPFKKKKETSCKYCQYAAVCQFDTTLKENTFKFLHEHKDEIIWDLMAQEGGDQ